MIQRDPNHQTASSPITVRFPSTRYQGSKAKLVDWIWQQLAGLDFKTCLDAFGGTGSMAYCFKQAGKQVTYNDLLRFNYLFGLALVENREIYLSPEEVDWLLQRHSKFTYPCFIQKNFHNIYFTEMENFWLDQTITNIRHLSDPYKFALAFFALGQACLIKRPYNLFHRKNLYLRQAEVNRSFGNKASWDRPFEVWFRIFVEEANQAVFDNSQTNYALNYDAVELPGVYDLVYIDPPYISGRGAVVNYLDFYHFLEGLAIYDRWGEQIDQGSKHRRLKRRQNIWADKKEIHTAFDRLFRRYQDSIIVISYRSDGIPSEMELAALLKQYKRNVQLEHFGRYQYVLSKNSLSKELLLVGY